VIGVDHGAIGPIMSHIPSPMSSRIEISRAMAPVHRGCCNGCTEQHAEESVQSIRRAAVFGGNQGLPVGGER